MHPLHLQMELMNIEHQQRQKEIEHRLLLRQLPREHKLNFAFLRRLLPSRKPQMRQLSQLQNSIN